MRKTLFALAFLVALCSTQLQAQCPATQPFVPNVAICAPANGSEVTAPVRIYAEGHPFDAPIYAMQVYLDGVKVYEQVGGSYDTSTMYIDTPIVAITQGPHHMEVVAYDTANRATSSVSNFTVKGDSGQYNCGVAMVPSVTVCSPASHSNHGTPILLQGSAQSKYPVTHIRVYADATPVYDQDGNGTTSLTFNQVVAVPTGYRRITLQAWDSTGTVFNTKVYITVY